MKQKLTEQELVNKLSPLIKEITELKAKRSSGVTLEKNTYIGGRLDELEQEISKQKTKPKADQNTL